MNALTRILLALSLLIAPVISSAQTKTYSTSSDFSRAELDQMLAPIALYPDTVLSHVLIASTYPLEVVQADRWARDNTQHTGQSAVNAVEAEDWDPSVKALVAFPEILRHMSSDLNWTQRLGDAFLDDENEVMAVIQDLRQKAYASGSLKKMEYVRVQHEDNAIVIEPTVERVVYIPYYDTRAVYGRWWWPDHPPVYWQYPRNHLFIGGTYWGQRVSLGSGFFFSSFQWHSRHLVVVDHRHHHPGFHSGRHIAHYKDARRWQHNPHHRRGVNYRNDAIRHHYRSSAQEQRHIDRAPHRHVRDNSKNIRNSTGRNESARDHDNQRTRSRLVNTNDQRSDFRQRPAVDERASEVKRPQRDLRDQRNVTRQGVQREASQVRQRDMTNTPRLNTHRTERRDNNTLRHREHRADDRASEKRSLRTAPKRDANNVRSPSNMRSENRGASGVGRSYHVQQRESGGTRENRR